jgi:hypothetical protein
MRKHSWVRAVGGVALVLGVATSGAGVGAEEAGGAKTAADLVGTWQYVADRTPAEQKRDPRERPPLGARFTLALEGQTVSLEQVRRNAKQVTSFTLDGKAEERADGDVKRSTSGRFEGGCLTMTARVDAPGKDKREITVTEHTLTKTAEGLIVQMNIREPIQLMRMALYKRAEDVPLPKPATAKIDALAWLAGRFTSTQGKVTMEEHWGVPAGGAMLGTARTVSEGKMASFEFLRIVERDGGLVYVAQPGGGNPVEFVLTEISATRALFENPLHDYPKRIVYERVGEDGLVTEISDTGGARAHRAEYKR